jgi:2'-5' RNA ligase
MSPFPQELVDRWHSRPENNPGEGTAYWHILLGGDRTLCATVKGAQERLSAFPGLHMTPLHRLHITVLAAGPATDIGDDGMAEMLANASSYLSGVSPVNITVDRVLYHPEAIALQAHSRDSLMPILQAAAAATNAVKDGQETGVDPAESWMPHVTICYSTARQPAAPIISALGKQLPSATVRVEVLSLVIQRGAERRWDWHEVGNAELNG